MQTHNELSATTCSRYDSAAAAAAALLMILMTFSDAKLLLETGVYRPTAIWKPEPIEMIDAVTAF